MKITLSVEFPRSVLEPFTHTSPVTPIYNCIAWAAGVSDKWYEPDPYGFYFWPRNIPRQYSIEAYIMVYENIGYIRCENGDLESGYEKVAVFWKDKIPTHAAKQLEDGSWSSKLGKNIDVAHSISSIEEGIYGTVAQFLKRTR